MKILWLSDPPWYPGGYGKQTKYMLPLLQKAGHDVALVVKYGLQGGKIDWEGIPIYPHSQLPAAMDVLVPIANKFFGHPKDGITISLLDIWKGLNPNPMSMLNWVAWLPIDTQPPVPELINNLKAGHCFPITMSKFGQAELKKFRINSTYIPCMVDTEIFKPADKTEARNKLGVPEDCFLVGMVGLNRDLPSRKAFPEAFYAFKQFQSNHPNAHLYVHTDITGSQNGVPLKQLVEALNIPEDHFHYPSPNDLYFGLNDEYMANCYNAMDVLLQPSFGEGFGVPIVEAQACGTSTIVNDWTAMPELTTGWKVKGQPFYTSLGCWYSIPLIEDIVRALQEAYLENYIPNQRAQTNREFALQFDVDTVFKDYWLPTLEILQSTLTKQSRIETSSKAEVPRVVNVSVLISTANINSAHAQRCIFQLKQSTVDYELIIIQKKDGWSFSSAINSIYRASTKEYILLLNDDCFVEPNTLEQLLAAISDKTTGVVGGKLLYQDGKVQHAGGFIANGQKNWKFTHHQMGEPDYDTKVQEEVEFITGALLMTKRSIIKELGFLDEQFEFGFEDADFCLRVKGAGYKVIYEPRAKAIHLHSETFRDQPVDVTVSKERFLKKHE